MGCEKFGLGCTRSQLALRMPRRNKVAEPESIPISAQKLDHQGVDFVSNRG